MSGRPDLTQGLWRGFTADHDEAEAAQSFEQRYGKPPEYIVEDRGVLFVGPIPAAPGRSPAASEAGPAGEPAGAQLRLEF